MGFTFNHTTKEDVVKEMKDLDDSKTSQKMSFLQKQFRKTLIFSPILYIRASMIDVCIFPTSLKLVNITPVFKKVSTSWRKNYKSVSILTNISKACERSLFKKMSNYKFKISVGFSTKSQCTLLSNVYD